ncbi:ATP-dependent nuclease [Pseudarthrobacter sp. NS4]|uniref:ATP-dependent nuclease n=1 Tax=Pseudarthrobacter sp. NS4 TaxID=2973976 RepID=UPI002163E22A|nr:ATP-dependent endonuclease [Pseudarthrobacter sp. NS4]
MHIKSFRIGNFRRLKNVRVDLEPDRTIFVGANNSGKTSATHVLQKFLGQQSRTPFQIYDFSADCWESFDSFDPSLGDTKVELPQISLDLWFNVDDDNLHRVLDLLPSLDWDGEPVGVRMVYAPREGEKLVANYLEARATAESTSNGNESSYSPWPQSMFEYLTKRLQQEYEIKYFVLDAKRCTEDLVPEDGYVPFFLGTSSNGASRVIESIIRIDFLNAQRHLSDTESPGRSEELSKRLSRFYERNLQKLEGDLDALGAIADSEARLNAHFAEVFGDTLDRLGEVGYPGVANPGLVVKASFNAHGILNTSAKVHYELPTVAEGGTAVRHTLPDQYNGLGFKNLIYMVVEVLDFHQAWSASAGDRPPIHLIVIEEPEAHLHAQLQQVFIRKILEILPEPEVAFHTQLVVTTHSPHIIYESNFKPIRYFCRATSLDGLHLSDVRNLSTFYREEEVATREFLQQYIKLTHCDLFFADAAVLVEGNVERLLLPLVIERFVPGLRSCHLTILEVGGAFAYRFESLLGFLGLPTLVITDLDSVNAPSAARVDDEEATAGSSCEVDTVGAVTSNQTLKQWLPKIDSIEDLLAAGSDAKAPATEDGLPGLVRVAYQTLETISWQGKTEQRAGRTLEEAFALRNLNWTQSADGKQLGLKIPKATDLSIKELHDRLFTRVKNFDKTSFALGVIATANPTWESPMYIVEGLEWLQEKLEVVAPVEARGLTTQSGGRGDI